ncbi:MAG: hypothetical protein C4589_12540 [Peptococcaceae bacterium]|nr:MAG: hypothetical protein C4589_12540 [Peptococcaceae bacterium]
MIRFNKVFFLFISISVFLVVATVSPQKSFATELKKFSCYEDMDSFIKKNITVYNQFNWLLYSSYRGGGGGGGGYFGDNFSITNIQVEGIDEADIVKNDGEYLYIATGQEVAIVKASPAERAKVLAKIVFNGQIQGLYINKNKLVVFGEERIAQTGERFSVKIFDVNNKEKPVLMKSIAVRGYYNNYYDYSRMIGDYVYFIVDDYVFNYNDPQRKIKLPEIIENGNSKTIPANEIWHFAYYDFPERYKIIVSINTQDKQQKMSYLPFLANNAQDIFVSAGSIYLTNPKTINKALCVEKFLHDLSEILPSEIYTAVNKLSKQKNNEDLAKQEEILRKYINNLNDAEFKVLEEKITDLIRKLEKEKGQEIQKATIHKLSIDKGNIGYNSYGEVKGRVLNRVSMDEYEGFFRVATTSTRGLLGQSITRNNIYVFNESMRIAGKLEGLAPTEKIYSARFMGNRMYLVTFRQIDPLFVVDLKNPYQPKVLGELKIPGYSNYLHPYDESHLIGVGKEVTPGSQRPGGVKVALFDVSNPKEPREISQAILEEGSDSEALREHKAFLFSKKRNLLVLPINLWRYADEDVFVFDISLDKGITVRGKIKHLGVKRFHYIGNVLYTISDNLIKMSDLTGSKEINKLGL